MKMAIYIPKAAVKNETSNTSNNNTVLSGEALINRIDKIASEIKTLRNQPETSARNASINTLTIERNNLLNAASKDNSLWY